jgi:hypothetical protein
VEEKTSMRGSVVWDTTGVGECASGVKWEEEK